MLQIGIAGLGFMGMIHYLAYQRVPGVRVTALCSRDKKKLAGDWRKIRGNFGPLGTKMDLGDVRKYETLESMLADKELDLIDVCLPPLLHRPSAVAASKAQKHVFCEKPIALTSRDADVMLSAAESAGKQLLIGHVLPFFPEYAWVLKAAGDRHYGKLLGGRFYRSIAEPKWIPDYFNPETVGGPLIDLLVHDAHFIRVLFGKPKSVTSCGRMRRFASAKVVEYVDTQFAFSDDDLVVTAAGGVIRQAGRAFTQAFEIQFERATCIYDFAVVNGKPCQTVPLTVLEVDGTVSRPKLGSGDPLDAFTAEVKEVTQAIQRGKPSTIINGELAADAVTLCQCQNKSVENGESVRI